MENLNVPIKSITEVKKSPMSIFQEAHEKNNGVYIFNRDKIAGVVLTQNQYEAMNNEIMYLREKLEEFTIVNRLKDKNAGILSFEEVTGESLGNINLDENDGWE